MSESLQKNPRADPPASTRVAPVSSATRDALAQSAAIMAHLRGPNGCPWDREQTFDSIKRHTLEETYEVFDAIDRGDWPALKDELGDLLLQVLFYAQMAEESGHFSLQQVAENLNAKLIRRHPHIFADALATTAEDVNRTWEAVKKEEKAVRGESHHHHLDAVPQYLPAMLEAQKLGARAAKVGFDWPSVDGLFDKLVEEAEELKRELSPSMQGSAVNDEAIADELGDLLFTAVNLARHLHHESEFALRLSNRKFRLRFDRMEELAGGADALAAATPSELEGLWQQTKQQLSAAEAAKSQAKRS